MPDTEQSVVGALDDGRNGEVEGFVWAANSRVPVRPEVAAAEIKAIHSQNGVVTPSLVVERAADPANPLHPAFEWNDAVAGASWRDSEARLVMRALLVVYRKPNGELTPPTRYLVKLVARVEDPATDDATAVALQPKVYLPVRQIMSEPDQRRRYVEQALRELVSWRNRYRDIEEFAHIFATIDQQVEAFKA